MLVVPLGRDNAEAELTQGIIVITITSFSCSLEIVGAFVFFVTWWRIGFASPIAIHAVLGVASAEHAVLNRWMHGRLSLGTSLALLARKALSDASWRAKPRTWTLDLEDEDEDENEDLANQPHIRIAHVSRTTRTTTAAASAAA